ATVVMTRKRSCSGAARWTRRITLRAAHARQRLHAMMCMQADCKCPELSSKRTYEVPRGVVCCRAGRRSSRRHSRLILLSLFCRIVAIGVTLALPACTDFKKDFLCRPDGHCVDARAGHTPTQ